MIIIKSTLLKIPHVQKLLLTNVIAPHGITDIIHAYSHRGFSQLAICYGTSMLTTSILGHHKYYRLLYALLCISSFFHFRHDFYFPTIQSNWCTNICTIGTLYSMIREPMPLFYTYMCILHVPHHFEMAWSYISPYKIVTIALFATVSICTRFMLKTSRPQSFIPLWIGIILGHIWYGEKYIHQTI